MTCFSKQKGPSPGAAFSPGSEEEIAESHILPPPRSPFLKGGRLGKRPASRVEDHLQGEAARENQSLAALPRQGWRARMNSSARKIPVKKKKIEKKSKPAQEKTPLTPQSYPDLGPGCGGASRDFFFPCSRPPAIGGQGVGGQRGRGLSTGRTAGLGVCSCRSMPRANCCHSQEEGGGQGIMTQVSLGWYSLQGLLASWWSPCPGLSPDQRTTPAAETGARHRLCGSALLCLSSASFWAASGLQEMTQSLDEGCCDDKQGQQAAVWQ